MAEPRRVEGAGIEIEQQAPPPAAAAAGRERRLSSSSLETISADVSNMTTSTPASARDVSNQDVAELVRREMKAKAQWFVDEIVSKVKQTNLVESPELAPTETVTPLTEEEPPSPQPALPPRWNKYQATVEDGIESQDEDEVKVTPSSSQTQRRGPVVANGNGVGSSRASSVASESPSSKASNLSSSRTTDASEKPQTPGDSPQPSPKSRPTVRFSDRVPVVLHNRPSPPPRKLDSGNGKQASSTVHGKEPSLSAIDLTWGKLFDERGEPTMRLGQFLRGIAKYIAAEYSPVDSMVLTPDKLLAFYSKFKLESEAFPFQQIFDVRPRGALNNLEDLYQDLRCNYWLVTSRPNSRSPPYIPALTPIGFAEWMIQHIQAFPEQEARRLSRILAELPIEADTPARDGNPERLPKQLSRHLLPADRHKAIHESVVHAIESWFRAAGYADLPYRRDARDDSYRSSRKSLDLSSREDIIPSRSKPDQGRKGHRSRSRRASQDGYIRGGDRDRSYYRSEPSSRYVARTNSEQLVRHPRDISPPAIGPQHRVRSPVGNKHYRNSVPTLSTTGEDYGFKDYGLTSSGFHGGVPSSYPGSGSQQTNFGERRAPRDQEYRFYQGREQGREPRTTIENTPRSLGHGQKRQSLVLSVPQQNGAGPTYEEYMRASPRRDRNSGLEDGGSYYSSPSNGAVQ